MTRTSILAVVAVAGLAGVASWRAYAESRLGQVELTNDGPPLMAQLLPESGDEPLGEPVDVVTRSTLSLPAGDYRLRVHGAGRLGRTYRLAVVRGETRSFALALDEGRLLGQGPTVAFGGQPKPREEPIPFAAATTAVALTSGRADLIERSQQALVRRDGITGKATWEIKRRPTPPGNRREPTTWMDDLLGHSTHPLLSRLVEPAADLDGDGVADPVWSLSNSAALLAVAGKDGAILWNFTAALDGPGGPRPVGPDQRPGPNANRFGSPGEPPVEPGGRWRQILGASAAPDLDGDGAPDLIATVTFSETEEEVTQRTGAAPDPNSGRRQPPALQRRIVVAVSGRSGRSLWTRPLDEAFTTLAPAAYERPVEVVPARGWVALTLIDGDRRWVALDAATGRPRLGPIDLGFAPVRPIQHADLDGDGAFDLLALGPGQAPGELTLAAFAGASGRALWSAPVVGKYAPLSNRTIPPRWPLVADLDGDGRPEVVVADAGPLPPGPGYRGLRLLDGATGRPRWARPMRPETTGDDGLIEILDAPDLDGDGVRDLVATSSFLGRSPSSPNEGTPPTPERAYVDALSGRDGRPLWWWHRDQPTDKFVPVRPLRWWGRGPDGWPLLAVGLGGHDPQSPFSNINVEVPPIVHNLEASTGRDVATAVGLGSPDVADLDGDGLMDLWGEANGLLRAFRGEAPEVWRALGRLVPADAPRNWPETDTPVAADLDGDGTADVLSADLATPARNPKGAIASLALQPALAQGFPSGGVPGSAPPGSRTAVARSGRDGRLLWTAALDESWFGLRDDRQTSIALTAPPLPGGDLDGDGTPDVIAQVSSFGAQPGVLELKHAATLPLRVLSGRTGRRLWSVGPLPLGFRAFGDSQVGWTRPLIIEPGAPPDLVVGHSSPFAATAPPSPGFNAPLRLHLARVGGRTGQVLWDVALSEEAAPQGPQFSFIPHFGDVDGDGALDVVLAVPTLAGPQGWGYELRAIALRDGRLLWVHRINPRPGPFNQPAPVVADLDGDRRAEVIVDDQIDIEGKPAHAFQALDGRDGQPRWTFRAGPSDPQQPGVWPFLADLDGRGRPSVALAFTNGGAADAQGVRRLVVLDAEGRVRADRDLTTTANLIRSTGYTTPRAVDLTGDGRDEVMFFSAGRLRVWGPDLKEIWSLQQDVGAIDRVVPGSAGWPVTLLSTQPVQALDGADGHPRWAGHAPAGWWGSFRPQLLDPGGPGRLPLLVSQDLGATICRRAIPTTPQGLYEPPRGDRTPPGLARADPRWTRPLPWVDLVHRDDVRSAALPTLALALLNVGLPLALLRLAAGRRARSLRLVMAVPAAAALPLIAFRVLEPSIPALPAPWPSSPPLVFLLISLAGAPILACPALAGWALARRRWGSLAWLAGLTAMAALAVGVGWLSWDRRTMPAIEHYDWAGWGWAIAPGACVASILMLVGWSVRGAIRLIPPRR